MLNLTVEQKEILANQARNELSKKSFRDYLIHVHHGAYSHFRHTELIAEKLQRIAEGEQKHLIFELPPRHGKSMTITESFPSYYIGKNPSKRVIATAYGDSLARKFGRLNKQKLQEFGADIFDVEIGRESSKATNWTLDGHRGGMLSTGIGGGITGEGADLLIVDDPFKNRAEANSATIRDKIWDEWQNTLLTRLQKGASVVVIMTRWHEDDLIGRLLASEPEKWERIRLPAIAEDEDDLLGREIGEPLCPELGFDEVWAEDKKKSVGSMVWSALYQQRPSPADGEYFKRKHWKYYKVLPDLSEFDEIIQSWDMAFKDSAKNDNDFVVGEVWGRIGANKYLIDMVRGRMNFPATVQAFRNLTARYPEAHAKLVEDKANGTAVIQTLSNEITGIIPVNPEGGKESRASSASVDVEAGNVYLPDPSLKPWVHDFVEEHASFPNGAHDDMVDAHTQASNRFNNKPKPNIRML